jgi:hypothetical protein
MLALSALVGVSFSSKGGTRPAVFNPHTALSVGVPLGLLCGLPAAFLWLKHASELARRPAKVPAIFGMLFDYKNGVWPRWNGAASAWNVMFLVGAAWFFGLATGGTPDIGPSLVAWGIWQLLHLLAYTLWWWRLPPASYSG